MECWFHNCNACNTEIPDGEMVELDDAITCECPHCGSRDVTFSTRCETEEVKPIAPCDECGETKPLRQTIDEYGQSFGESHCICQACYNEHPEPDTGRPDWTDLEFVKLCQ